MVSRHYKIGIKGLRRQSFLAYIAFRVSRHSMTTDLRLCLNGSIDDQCHALMSF
jgi:hypothetical protein